MNYIDKRVLTHFDYLLIILVLPLVFISGHLINEVVPALGDKHTVYSFVGIAVFFIIFFIPLRKFIWLIPVFYWLNIILLVLVGFIGKSVLGAQRWIEIPFIHFTIQPSEFMKPALILMLAYLIHRNPPTYKDYDIKKFLHIGAYILLPFFLILKQPDLGTALVLLLIGIGVLFIVGVQWKIWATILFIVAVAFPALYSGLHDYQKKRVKDFLSEKPSYHVQQSIIAIGSGGLMGQSKDEATQTQMHFLPIATSDFIFAYVVERYGFLGAMVLITIYIFIILHLISIYYWMKDDYLIKVVSSAIAFMIFIYMSLNIAMTIGLAPVVGLPLPMFSYGGSSFVTFIALLALLENLLAFRFNHTYNTPKGLE
jgi:rod shape determining protein RodA